MTYAPPRPAQPKSAAHRPQRGLTPDARSTLVVIFATCCAVLPLRGLFTDTGWLVGVWFAVILLLGPAVLLRQLWPAHIAQTLPGLALTALYLTHRFLGDSALWGIIPWRNSGAQLSGYGTELGTYIRDSVAPSPSIPAAVFVLTVLLVALAVFSDAIAVVFRGGALLALPYLTVITLVAAATRHTPPWWIFVIVALAYLTVLADSSRESYRTWGPVMSGREKGQAQPERGSGLGGPLATGLGLGATSVIAALVITALLPISSRNGVADVLHHSGANGDGSGTGGTGGTSLDPFVSLKGDLTRNNPVDLFSVHVSGANPYYLRQIVLDDFAADVWEQGAVGTSTALRTRSLPLDPADPVPNPKTSQAEFTISGLTAGVPTLQHPAAITGLGRSAQWNSRTGVISGGGLKKGDKYTESVQAPEPTVEQLDAVPEVSATTASLLAADLQLPASLPEQIRLITMNVAGAASGPYEQAKTLAEYFTNPVNGFIYSLSTKLGNSGSDLLDFLTNKQGYCQQYAAAMAVMLRILGVPARVVIGYTHVAANASGDFTVTSNDAHAWVEAYMTGIGWTAFDPTPLAGADSARAQTLPYVPAQTPVTAPSTDPTQTSTPKPTPQSQPSSATPAATDQTQTSSPALSSRFFGSWVRRALNVAGLIVLLVLVAGLIPRLVRRRRRRIRLRAFPREGIDPLWEEFTATARDLGVSWSRARSPRQVGELFDSGTLPISAESVPSLLTLSSAVEDGRYAPPPLDGSASSTDLLRDLQISERGLRAAAERRTRLRARFFPAETLEFLGGLVRSLTLRRR